MKVLFAHDHRFIRYGHEVLSESQFDASLWERYLEYFQEIVVLGREDFILEKDPKKPLIISSATNVSFILLENISTMSGQLFYKKNISHRIEQEIEKVDAVIARLPSEIGLLAIHKAKYLGKPWAVEMVGCPWDSLWNYGSLKHKLYAPLLVQKTKKALKESNFSIYVSQVFLQKRYPSKKNALAIGCSDVSIAKPSYTVLRKRLLKIKEKQGTKVKLGLIGTLRTKYKGIQTVLDALRSITKVYPNISFHILGEGDQSEWIDLVKQGNLSNVVFFDGTLSQRKDVFNWLDSVDIYLQPSFQEGLPRALVEAMSRGCPCIGSTCGGIPELLDKDWLISPGDSKHLSSLVIKMIENNGDYQSLQAEKNWNKTKEFSEMVLDNKRRQFFSKFHKFIQEKN